MNVLLVKTSSLGDVIHTLPALTEARQQIPGIQFDWLVEEAFAEVPSWHPAVRDVIPVAIRRWRRSPLEAWRSGEVRHLRQRLASASYDRVIDAQGLLKTVWLTRLNAALSTGFDRASAREPAASWFYDQGIAVPREMHAVERTRQLFAGALGYERAGEPEYGLAVEARPAFSKPYVFLLHGTTWATKHYPERSWVELVRLLKAKGLLPVVTWGSESEKVRAERLAVAGAEIIPKTSLANLAAALKGAKGAVTVDTGLGHLAAALNVPLVALYGPTDPHRSGIYGPLQKSLQAPYHCAPCMKRRCRFEVLEKDRRATFEPPCWSALSAEGVWFTLSPLLGRS